MNVLIYGDGALAEQYLWQLESDDRYEVVGFCVDDLFFEKKSFHKVRVFKFQELSTYFDMSDVYILVAIGYTKMNSIREKIFNSIEESGYNLLTYISKSAIIGKHVIIGKGSFIGNYVVISPSSIIGKGCIIYSNTCIGHYCRINDFCYLSICVALGGHVTICKNCFLGMHVTVRDGVLIDDYNVIGTATNVLAPTETKGIYVGNPAVRLKDVDIDKVKI